MLIKSWFVPQGHFWQTSGYYPHKWKLNCRCWYSAETQEGFKMGGLKIFTHNSPLYQCVHSWGKSEPNSNPGIVHTIIYNNTMLHFEIVHYYPRKCCSTTSPSHTHGQRGHYLCLFVIIEYVSAQQTVCLEQMCFLNYFPCNLYALCHFPS